ncbi:ABC transporter ATP-binding protein [Calditerricola satsumensis]|uniref:ABC transporter ATP-binding protein n=1 Tax=Calditerricola satsumensis TaxID=373054 RepID=A0A8J3FAZ2_9BACI|nr:ABC transporter ATP-binding protein [Calditerricola satsumensis]GGJ99612.1 ABC transporter ATP-binding protein [Calditerricola satsumensis]
MNGGKQRREPVLAVRGLSKRIGRRTLVEGVTFDVYPGEVFGFLGPNGAGKTTTIRMLVGLIRPSSGSVTIAGFDVHRQPEEALRRIGCIVENPELYPFLSGRENLLHFARMIGGVPLARIEEVARIVGLERRLDDKVKTYSLGMRQRLGIAQALLARPELLILDEPTNGLDPSGIREMRELIRALAAEGLAVFVSSHLLAEVQLMCDRVALIHRGRILRIGRVDELLAEDEGRVAWHVDNAEVARRVLAAVPQVRVLDEDEGPANGKPAVVCHMPFDRIPEANRQLAAAQVAVYGIVRKVPTLEEWFLRLTEGEGIA